MEASNIKKLNGADKNLLTHMVDCQHVNRHPLRVLGSIIGKMKPGYWLALRPVIQRQVMRTVFVRHHRNRQLYGWVMKGTEKYGHCGQ